MNNSILRVLTGASVLALCPPAFAQAPGTAETNQARGTDQRDGEASSADIIVTARRFEERLQDVPISISVFNQQQLTDRNVVTATDLAAYTPSLTTNNNFGNQNTTFIIRGFFQEASTPPSVGVYFADVVAPRGAASNYPVGNGATPGDFFDLQNVQVLKGPQGTLQGRNTTGGAVLLVPQKPTGEFGGYLEGSYGNYDMKRVQAVLNLPLSDVARLRLGADVMDRDGFIRNTTGIGPRDFADIRYVALRASLVVDLTPNLENYLIGSYIGTRDHGQIQKLVACDPTNAVIGAGLACPALARNQAAGNGFYTAQNSVQNPFTRTDQFRFINTTTWNASDTVTVKNIVSYAELRQRNNAMLFGTVFNTADLSPIVSAIFRRPVTIPSRLIPFSNVTSVRGGVTSEQSTFTEELQVAASFLDGRLTLQSGAYFEKSVPLRSGGSQSAVFISCTDVVSYQCVDATAGTLSLGQVSFQSARQRFRDVGLYAQATYRLNDQFKVTGGFRYTWDRDSASGIIGFNKFAVPNTPVFACTIPTSAPSCLLRASTSTDAPTWLIDLDYTPTNDVLVYAKYARGYRAGGVSLQAPPEVNTFRPEKVDTYEVGLKTSFGGAVSGTFNVAAFYNDFSDQQLQLSFVALPPNTGQATGVVNAGRSRLYGAEVDTSVSLFTGFVVDASYAYLKTEIREFVPPAAVLTGYTFAQQSVQVGDPIPLAPKHKFTVTGTYTLPLDESVGRLSIGATFTHTGGQLSNYQDRLSPNPVIAALTRLDARDLLNLNLNWRRIGGSPVDLALFATNITKEKYFSYTPGLARAVGFETAVLGEPRMYGVRLRYNFGR